MILLGILMVYLVGASILTWVSRDWSWAELLAFSLPIGIGVETVFMFGCDVVGLQFSTTVLFMASFAVVIAGYDGIVKYIQQQNKLRIVISLSTINYASVLLLICITALFYFITQKNMYWPTTEHDAIGSFDKMGIVMALEGRIHVSLFEYGLQGAGGTYPPLFHGGIAYMYLFGASQPKIITTLYFVSLLVGFYAMLRLYTSSMMALFFTLLLEFTPELYSHAALLLGNLPTTVYVGGSAIALFIWIKSKAARYYWLATILTIGSLWIRSDTVGFALAGVLLIACYAPPLERWRRVGVYGLCSALTVLAWNLYLNHIIHLPAADRVILSQITDGQRIQVMLHYLLCFFSFVPYQHALPGIQYYGIAFLLFFVILLLNIHNVLRDQSYILLYLLVSLAVYFAIFLVINESVQKASIDNLMESSFKRGLFCFLPIVLYYSATSAVMLRVDGAIARWRAGGE